MDVIERSPDKIGSFARRELTKTEFSRKSITSPRNQELNLRQPPCVWQSRSIAGYSADGHESGGIRRSGDRTRTNQRLKPDVLRLAVRGGDAQRIHQLALIFFIRKKPSGRLGPFLLQSLQNQHTAVVRGIRQQ